MTHRPARRATAAGPAAPRRSPLEPIRPSPKRSTPPSSAPCCAGTAGSGAGEPPDATAAGPHRGPAAAAPACSCPRAGPSPTATTCSARPSSRSPAAARPSAREVLVGLAVPSDEIRWWRDVPTGPAGAASWTVEEQLRAAARQMLLAGALATRARAGYYGARHRRTAARLPGERPGRRRPPADAASPRSCPSRTGRPLAVRLHQALYAAREAIDYQRATGGMDAFDARRRGGRQPRADGGPGRPGARHGGRADRRRVVARRGGPRGLRGPRRTRRVLARRPARAARGRRPLSARGAVRAGPDHRHRGPDAQVGAARRGRRTAAGAGRRRGPARPDDPGRGGVPDRRATPTWSACRCGCTAGWRAAAASGGSTDASGVVPVQVDEAERDRLMKSLQENLDFFEEACSEDD